MFSMHRYGILVLLIVIGIFSFKNVDDKSVFDFSVNYFDVDILGNLYLVHGNELSKYDKEGKRKATYTNLSLGDISSIDASDAMNLLVFYEDFGKVIFLDNTLSIKKSAISLADLGFPNATLVCLSYNNSFWLFDPVNQELIRINQFLEISERSGNLNQIIQTEIEPNQLFETGNHVYLKDVNEGVFIFDRYGGFLKRMPFLQVDDLQLSASNTLQYLRNDTLFEYNMKLLDSDTLVLKHQNIKRVKRDSFSLYFLNKKGRMYIDNIQK
jgi:hypothetical protein